MERIKDKRCLVAVALATVVLVVFVLWRPAAIESVYPFDRARVSLSSRVGSVVAGFFDSVALADENARLRREIGAQSLLQIDMTRLREENAQLRAAFSFRERARGEWIVAEILSGGGAVGVRHMVRLSKGAEAGVVEGAVVVVPDGLAGRVVSVTPHTCTVMLVTDPSIRIACEIETGSGRPPRGIVCGGEDDCLELRYLSRAGGLRAAGQRVLTSGLGGVFPKGILVGVLVDRKDLTGSVRPVADLMTREFMLIRREN